MAEQQAKPKSRKHSERWNHYSNSSGTLTRNKRFCPKCGPGYFMADHKNRITCGKCSYVEFKGKEPEKQEEKPSQDSPKQEESDQTTKEKQSEETKSEEPEPKKE
ncbi:30S ribosomal protein S27ae [Candidatus Woesearchaeota archaeon]|nr:30S ribosomal protein S27ae [Candidatus Woesearchaeota archaeon]